MQNNKQEPKNSGVLQAMAATTVIGAEMAITVTIGFYGGRILDRHFDTAPWLMITGILLGLAAGTWGIVSTVKYFWGK